MERSLRKHRQLRRKRERPDHASGQWPTLRHHWADCHLPGSDSRQRTGERSEESRQPFRRIESVTPYHRPVNSTSGQQQASPGRILSPGPSIYPVSTRTRQLLTVRDTACNTSRILPNWKTSSVNMILTALRRPSMISPKNWTIHPIEISFGRLLVFI